MEPLLPLAPFCKKPLVLTLTGITTDGKDASVCFPASMYHTSSYEAGRYVEAILFTSSGPLSSLVRRSRTSSAFTTSCLLPYTHKITDSQTRSSTIRRRRSNLPLSNDQSAQTRVGFRQTRSSTKDPRCSVSLFCLSRSVLTRDIDTH